MNLSKGPYQRKRNDMLRIVASLAAMETAQVGMRSHHDMASSYGYVVIAMLSAWACFLLHFVAQAEGHKVRRSLEAYSVRIKIILDSDRKRMVRSHAFEMSGWNLKASRLPHT